MQAQIDTKDQRIGKELKAHQKISPPRKEVPPFETAIVFRRRSQKNPTNLVRSTSATIRRTVLVKFQIRQDRHHGMHTISR